MERVPLYKDGAEGLWDAISGGWLQRHVKRGVCKLEIQGISTEIMLEGAYGPNGKFEQTRTPGSPESSVYRYPIKRALKKYCLIILRYAIMK